MEGSVFEVGLRDGLQSEATEIALSAKLELLKKLVASGIKRLELGSFVRSDKIPQLANTDKLVRLAHAEFKNSKTKPEFWAFVPNRKGLERALSEELDGVSVFYSCSETFSLKNVNKTRDQVLSELKEIVAEAKKNKLKLRAYLSTIVYCPYEGIISQATVLEHVDHLLNLGVEEIALSDTTGHALPTQISKLCGKVMKKAPPLTWALHLHDTRGLALANAWEGLKQGVSKFDSSIAGLGGCPYAPGAAGNLATEDLAYLLNGVCDNTNLDLTKIGQAGFYVEKLLGRKLSSKVLRSLEGGK